MLRHGYGYCVVLHTTVIIIPITKKDAGRVIRFHKFPLENEELCTKWVIATEVGGFFIISHKMTTFFKILCD